MIPVDIHGMATDKNQENYVVILNGKESSSDKWLPIQISATEAQNIAIQLNDMEPERPLSHDLLAKITEMLGGTVEEVQLGSEGNSKLQAQVKINQADASESTLLDASPSDAIALAIRTGAEIVVDETIMQTQDPTDPDAFENTHSSDEVTQLHKELDEAVENEEFEKASELKQEIRDAVRKHEESLEGIDSDVEDELEEAFHGSSEETTDDVDSSKQTHEDNSDPAD